MACMCGMSVDLSVDAMDVSGEQHIDVEHNIFKQRLNSTGAIIPLAPEKESRLLFHAYSRLQKLLMVTVIVVLIILCSYN